MIDRGTALRLIVILRTLQQHLLASRRVDAHEVETLRRELRDRCGQSDQYVTTCAMIAVLVEQLDLVDRTRPGLPLR